MKYSILFLTVFVSTVALANSGSHEYCPCGLNGQVADRVQECNETQIRNGYSWSLVSRDSDGTQVWRDDSTGLIWTPTLRWPHRGFLKLKSYVGEEQDAVSICAGEEASRPLWAGMNGISYADVQFHLPSANVVRTAIEHGLFGDGTHLNQWIGGVAGDNAFWSTNDELLTCEDGFWFYSPNGQNAQMICDTASFARVRCVGNSNPE